MKLWTCDWNEDVAPAHEPIHSSPLTPAGSASVSALEDTSARLKPSAPGSYVDPEKSPFAAKCSDVRGPLADGGAVEVPVVGCIDVTAVDAGSAAIATMGLFRVTPPGEP